MRNPTFRECWLPGELSDALCSLYGFSDSFRDCFARFLAQAPTMSLGGFRHLDEYSAFLAKRLGWSRPHAQMFVAGEWPASLLAPDFQQEVMKLEGVA